jgi:hypothetical protein
VAAQLNRLKPGDVLQLNTPAGAALLLYIGCHREYGDAVLVNSKVRENPSPITGQVFSDSYVAFYPAVAAVAQGLVQVINHFAPPKMPQLLRRPGARLGRRVKTWIIDYGKYEAVKSKLSEDELKLPIAVIWNHEMLIQRILEGWSPLTEGNEE